MASANPLATSWLSQGLRWLGTACTSTADAIDRNADEPLAPAPSCRPIDEYLDDVRFRMHSRM